MLPIPPKCEQNEKLALFVHSFPNDNILLLGYLHKFPRDNGIVWGVGKRLGNASCGNSYFHDFSCDFQRLCSLKNVMVIFSISKNGSKIKLSSMVTYHCAKLDL